MSLTGRGPADQYKSRRAADYERQQREEMQRHIQAMEDSNYPEEDEDYPVAYEEQVPVENFPEAKKKRGRWWRFFIG